MRAVPAEIDRERVRFEVGDACDLRADLGSFDVVLARRTWWTACPTRAVSGRGCRACVHPGGQLVIASPFTWLEEYTPPDTGSAGYERDGERVSGFETLRAVLAPDFEFVRARDLPFLIREHARKFQWSVSQAGVWRRR